MNEVSLDEMMNRTFLSVHSLPSQGQTDTMNKHPHTQSCDICTFQTCSDVLTEYVYHSASALYLSRRYSEFSTVISRWSIAIQVVNP